MNSRRLGLIVVLSVLCVGSAKAQTVQTTEGTMWDERFTYRADEPKYHDGELSFDAFGGYRKEFDNFGDMFDSTWRHGQWGGGVGLNYFFTRYVGLGVDTFFQERGTFFNNLNGNLILRMPIGNSGFAPYAFGGGGFRFDPVDEWVYGGGVGLEYRINRYTGIFSDIRYAWADKTRDNNLVRVGLRFAFDVAGHDDERR